MKTRVGNVLSGKEGIKIVKELQRWKYIDPKVFGQEGSLKQILSGTI